MAVTYEAVDMQPMLQVLPERAYPDTMFTYIIQSNLQGQSVVPKFEEIIPEQPNLTEAAKESVEGIIDSDELERIERFISPSQAFDLEQHYDLDSNYDESAPLALAGLSRAIPFNHVYRRLTGAVWNGVEPTCGDPKRSFFSQRQRPRVWKTVGVFAQLYFDALRAHAEGRQQDVPKAWQELFYGRLARNAPEGLQFLTGMGAHIILDLPQALAQTKAGEDYREDYTKVVNILIATTADELATRFIPGPDMSRKLLTKAAVHYIARIRETAWHDGQTLIKMEEAGKDTKPYVDKLDRRATFRSKAMLIGGRAVLGALDNYDKLKLAHHERSALAETS